MSPRDGNFVLDHHGCRGIWFWLHLEGNLYLMIIDLEGFCT